MSNLSKRRRNLIFTCLLLLSALFSSGCSGKEPVEIVYFYSIVCDSCQISKELKETGGMALSLKRNNPHLEIKTYDIFDGQGVELLFSYIDNFQVPAEMQNLPLLFIGDKYYSGLEEIQKALGEYMEQ